MNKKTKWGIIILVGAGIIGGGIYSQLPKKNDELTAADKIMSGKYKTAIPDRRIYNYRCIAAR